MKYNKLSEKMKYWRAERPDEWTMDEFIRDAENMERGILDVIVVRLANYSDKQYGKGELKAILSAITK